MSRRRVGRLWAEAWLLFMPSWILYGPSLFFPLFYDDLLHLALVEGRPWMDLLWPTPEYGYYRPLVLLWTRLAFTISGHHASLLLHLGAVAVHLLNIALLVRLLRVLPPMRPFAFIAGIIFGLFPFHYQAVLTPAFSLHVWQTAFFLCMGILYAVPGLRARLRHVLLSFLFLLALLNHETAVLAGVFLAGVDRLTAVRSRRWLPYLIAGAGYALLYPALPHGRPPGTMWSPPDLAERLRFAFQALAFPLLAGLNRWLGEGKANLAFGISLIWLALRWTAIPRDFRRHTAAAGLLFFLVAILPSVVLLPAGYLLHGLRLLYLGSAGVTVFWAACLKAPPHAPFRLRALYRVALVTIIMLAGAISQRQVDLYARALEPLRLVQRLPPSAPVRRALLVNFPEWIAYNTRIFPLGSEGALVFGGHLLPGTLLIANSTQRPEVQLLRVDLPFHRPHGYAFQPAGPLAGPVELLRGLQEADLILFTVYREAGPQTEMLLKSEARLVPLRVAFSEGLILEEGLVCQRATTVRIYLRWRRQGPLSSSLSLAVHLLDPERRILAQADGPPWEGAVPFEEIPFGESLLEVRTLPLRMEVPPAAVRIGLYDWRNGQRVTIQKNPYALPTEDGTFLILPIQLCSG